MDQLELLKKDWKNREQVLPTYSYKDIYTMLLKKSSSILKWIVVISLCEILFWTILSFFIPESNKEFNDKMGLKNIFLWINIFNYIIVGIFVVLFYLNYKKIQVTSSIKTLMQNILQARKTVHYFVYYNIGLAALMLISVNVYLFFNKDKLITVLKGDQDFSALPAETFTSTFFLLQFAAGAILIGLLILFYWLVYGLLLRRLKRNYKELEKIEMQ